MKRDDRAANSDLDALLERGRVVRRLPDIVRARALARARATMAAEASAAPAPLAATPARGRGLRIALAASVTLLAGAAGAIAALRGRALDMPTAAPASGDRPAIPARVVPEPRAPSPPLAPEPKAIAKRRPGRILTAQESYAAELRLLVRARDAYARRDFPAALALIADHARLFPNGRLIEEREALRVHSLASSGRTEDARQASAAFAARFPRSVLLGKRSGGHSASLSPP